MKKIIQIYGGPGAGKSTTASGLFYLMKLAGYKVELVTEFAKDLTYEGRYNDLNNQVYVFGKQLKRIKILEDKVDYIVTDSPILLSYIYSPKNYPPSFRHFVLDMYRSYENKSINILLNRVKTYQPYGRSQTAEESDDLGKCIEKLLIDIQTTFFKIDGDESAPLKIFNSIPHN